MGDGGLAETNGLGEITDAGFGIRMCGDERYQAQSGGFGDGLEHGGTSCRSPLLPPAWACGNPTAVAKLREGRIGISDIVAEDHLTPDQRAERGSYVGCIAGALSRSEYLGNLAAAGFSDASVRFTQQTADGMHSAIIQATKPR